MKEILENLIKEYQLSWKETRAAKAILAMALSYSKDQGIIAENPAENIKELKLNKRLCRAAIRPGDKSRRYGREEYDAFIEAAYQRLDAHPETISPAATLLIMYTAARIGEVAGMQFSDIDFERKTWQIARIETVNKKGQPCIENHGKGKSIHALRKIVLTDDCLELIQLARDTNEAFGYGDSDFVFCNSNGRITRTTIDHMFRTICSMIGMYKAKSAHDARRTVLSLLYAGLGPEQIDAIRRFAGHASIQQTLNYIFGLDTTETEDAMIRDVLSGRGNPAARPSSTMDVPEKSFARKENQARTQSERSDRIRTSSPEKIVQFPTKAV